MTPETLLVLHSGFAALATFCFGYPFVMAWYWMAGGLLLRFVRDRNEPLPDAPPPLPDYPLVSVLVPIWINYLVSVAWAYAMLAGVVMWAVSSLFPVWTGGPLGFSLWPKWWGLLLAMTYLLQSAVSMQLDRRFEDNMVNSLFWLVWYPLVFWMLQATAAVVGVPRAIARRNGARGTWISPDRGMR